MRSLPGLLQGDGMAVHLAMGGMALLLTLLLLVTPILENGEPSLGGTLLSRAELEVDAFPNGTVVLYVLSNGDVRFSAISLGINLTLPTPTGLSVASIHWTQWHNSTNRVVETVGLTNVSQFAVNVTATYRSSGTSGPEYVSWGVYAFTLSSTGPGSLVVYPLTPSLPSTSPQKWTFSDLPHTLALAEYTVTYL